jgi:DNA invertase Pin-like site-specific DNA recombinase
LGTQLVLGTEQFEQFAGSWHDLLNVLDELAKRGGVPIVGRQLGRHDDTTRRLMLTVLGGLAEFERKPRQRACTWAGRAS